MDLCWCWIPSAEVTYDSQNKFNIIPFPGSSVPDDYYISRRFTTQVMIATPGYKWKLIFFTSSQNWKIGWTQISISMIQLMVNLYVISRQVSAPVSHTNYLSSLFWLPRPMFSCELQHKTTCYSSDQLNVERFFCELLCGCVLVLVLVSYKW